MERATSVRPSRAAVGSRAPPFDCMAVVDGEVQRVTLSSFCGQDQWMILVFFPMAWSFICPTELHAFNERLSEFESRDCNVVFASTDSEHVLRAWTSTERADDGLGGVRVPLLSDRSHRLSRDYGILLEEAGVSQRATFIVDPAGVVRHSAVNDTNVGRSVDETKRLLEALIFTDRFGEGCPVDWAIGSPGIAIGEPERRAQDSLDSSSRVNDAGGGASRSRRKTWGYGLEARPGGLVGRNSEAMEYNSKLAA